MLQGPVSHSGRVQAGVALGEMHTKMQVQTTQQLYPSTNDPHGEDGPGLDPESTSAEYELHYSFCASSLLLRQNKRLIGLTDGTKPRRDIYFPLFHQRDGGIVNLSSFVPRIPWILPNSQGKIGFKGSRSLSIHQMNIAWI